MLPEAKSECAKSEPKCDEGETPAALAQEEDEADPEEASHEYRRLPLLEMKKW